MVQTKAKAAQTFLIAETGIINTQLEEALEALGAPDWVSDTPEDASLLTEFAGRLCYKSFIPGLNPNVTKVRNGNKEYLENILGQKHGSVFEHSTTSVLFVGVSRILTHELVRHRPGAAYSQESQRFVRLDKFELYVPDLTEAFNEIAVATGRDMTWSQEMQAEFLRIVDMFSKFGEEHIAGLINQYLLDDPRVKFHAKKKITSALRRLLPGGVNTNILVTYNHRSWRHVFANRTSGGAEQEIREVMTPLAGKFEERYPNIYQDIEYVHYDSDGTPLNPPAVRFHNEKV